MSKPMIWRPTSYVNLAAAMTLIVSLSACATKRTAPQELSQEVPQSAFNEENWDTFRSDRNVQTHVNKKTFKNRVRNSSRTQFSSVAGQ